MLTGDHHKLSWVQMRHPGVNFWKTQLQTQIVTCVSHRAIPRKVVFRCGENKNPPPNSSIYLWAESATTAAPAAHTSQIFIYVCWFWFYTHRRARCKVAITRPTRLATAKGNIYLYGRRIVLIYGQKIITWARAQRDRNKNVEKQGKELKAKRASGPLTAPRVSPPNAS